MGETESFFDLLLDKAYLVVIIAVAGYYLIKYIYRRLSAKYANYMIVRRTKPHSIYSVYFQSYSLTYGMMSYIRAQCPKTLHSKLIQSCKEFLLKNPYFVFRKIYFKENGVLEVKELRKAS